MPSYNPSVPYIESLKLVPGSQIRVDGCPTQDAKTLAINLQQGPSLNPRSPIVLHLAPVFGGYNGEGARVVRNHLVGDHWGTEESHGPLMPFARGQPFSVLVLVQDTHFKIAVNGTHFCEFAHRLPYFSCTHLVIDGDLSLNLVEVAHTANTSASVSAPTAPSAPPEPGFAPSSGMYPSLPNSYGDNNNYYPPGPPPYPSQAPPFPSAGPPGPGYPPPPYGSDSPYPPPPQPTGYPGPVQPGYPQPGGYPASPPAGYPTQPGYPHGAGYPPPGSYPGYPTQPGAPPPASNSGGPLGGLGAALGAGGIGAALGTAASKVFGNKHQHKVPGTHSGHSSSGPGLGTALGVGAGALAAGALLKHVNPFKKVKKIFDYSSSSDSD